MAFRAEYNPNLVEAKECIVEGVIETKHLKALEVLLHGISGSRKKDVKMHEIILKSEQGLGIGPQELHLQCSLEGPDPLWTATIIGGSLRGAVSQQIPVEVRNRDDCRVSGNALWFFDRLGYKFDHELLRVGFVFNIIQKVPVENAFLESEITVSATSIHKIPKKFEIDKSEPLSPSLCLVEISTGSTADNYTEAVAAISALSDILAPLIHLSKPGTATGFPLTASAAATAILSRRARRVP